MRLTRLCAMAGVLTVAFVALPPAANAATARDNGNYIRLTENRVGGMTIGSDTTLDCANHTIHGLPGMPYGVLLIGAHNSTVQNCVITGSFGFGIYTVSDGNNKFLNN